jgi:Zn-dependent M28 family amino/carboxypeptidase
MESTDVSGDLVFVSYGVRSEELHRDDLAGLDVKGKIVMLFMGNGPDGSGGAWNKVADEEVLLRRLIDRGATGFVVHDDRWPYALIANDLHRRHVALADEPAAAAATPPVFVLSDDTAQELLRGLGPLAQLRQRALAGEFLTRDLHTRATLSARIRSERRTGSNVIGILDGSDPGIRGEALVYTAHYDAFGMDYDGTIHPGAIDNAAGVGKLVAIAEALSQSKPRRSIVFLPTGEEYFDLGSKFWLRHPSFPLDHLAADINYDGGLEVWGHLGFVLDLGFEHSDLGDVVTDAATALHVQIVPDPAPELDLFGRSDHYEFIQNGIPSLFLAGLPAMDSATLMKRAETWYTTAYHMPADAVQANWDWDGARSLAVIGLVAGMRIADRDAMPVWSPNSPYRHPRGTLLPAKAR